MQPSREIRNGHAGFSILITVTKTTVVDAWVRIAANRHERIHQPDGFFQVDPIALEVSSPTQGF
ncbi:hypothetical protein MPLB_20063 [Mesorhizobium sp. ORS 3324]|nr:hypothetical protein MPLB_20063 [Mesorhizobium sp. ORS 3324]